MFCWKEKEACFPAFFLSFSIPALRFDDCRQTRRHHSKGEFLSSPCS